LKWAPTGEPSSIDFENGTNGPVTLEALTVFRDEPPDSPTPFRATALRVLAPGHAMREPIRQGRKYRMIDETGKCLGTFEAISQPARARVGENSIRARLGIPPFLLRATLETDKSIRPDGQGTYVDGSGGVFATVCEALSLWLGASGEIDPCGAGPEERRPGVRTLSIDLGKPVESSGAKRLASTTDSQASIHVFLNRDRDRHFVNSIYAVNPGETVQSDRVQIVFNLDGQSHVLLVGPWGPGEFNREQKTVLHGEGSTKATVRRVSNTTWIVDAPQGSIGRLWNNADKANPIDRGLYYVSFRVTFEILSDRK
jgi:hypothetical protein